MINLTIFLFFFIIMAGDANYITAGGRNEIGLKEIETIGIENNFNLKAIRSEMAIHNEIIKSKFRDFFPAAAVSYRNARNIAERDLDSGSQSIQLSITQPLYDSGRKHLNYEISRLNLRLTAEKYRSEKNRLRFSIRKSYMSIQQKREIIDLLRKNLLEAESLLKRSKNEYDLGIITEIDYLEINNEYRKRGLILKQNIAEHNDALNDLFFLLNKNQFRNAEIKRIDFNNIIFKDLNKSDEEIITIAEQNSIRIKEAKISEYREQKEYLISKYSYLPLISVTGHIGKNGEKWPLQNFEWGVGVNVSLNFFGNSISNTAAYRTSKNGASRGYSTDTSLNIYDNPSWKQSMRENELSLAKSRELNFETRHAVQTAIKRLLRSIKERETALKLAEEITVIQKRRVDIEKEKYLLGEISLHDYLREELNLNDSSLNLIRERADCILNINQLEMEMGIDLDSLHLYDIKEYSSSGEN